MTLAGSQLKHKMDSLATLPETDEYVWVRFHMDLEQWNYTLRSHQQSYLVDVMCQIFGVDHFKFVTQIFTDSWLISANKFTFPAVLEDGTTGTVTQEEIKGSYKNSGQ